MDAIAVLGEARRQKNRPVNSADHLIRRDLFRIARQLVAAIGPVLRPQEPVLHQLLQDLREQRRRDPVGLGDLLGARTRRRIHRQVLQSDEPVVRFFSQLEHSDSEFRPDRSYIIITDLHYNRQVELFQPDRYWRLEVSDILEPGTGQELNPVVGGSRIRGCRGNPGSLPQSRWDGVPQKPKSLADHFTRRIVASRSDFGADEFFQFRCERYVHGGILLDLRLGSITSASCATAYPPSASSSARWPNSVPSRRSKRRILRELKVRQPNTFIDKLIGLDV